MIKFRGGNREAFKKDLAAKVQEFSNPYHDEKGRFTDGPGLEGLKEPGGGATIDPRSGKDVVEGYAVALEGHSSITPVDEFLSGNPPKGAKILSNWIKDAKAQGLFKNPAVKVGLWHDPDSKNIFIDASEQVMSRSDAIKLGKERDQIGIYHLKPGGEGYIPTGGTGGL